MSRNHDVCGAERDASYSFACFVFLFDSFLNEKLWGDIVFIELRIALQLNYAIHIEISQYSENQMSGQYRDVLTFCCNKITIKK